MSRKDLLLVMFVMIIWGVNFSMIKLGLTEVNPLILTAIRFALAVIPVVFFIPKPDVNWSYIISYGLVFGFGVWGLASWSIEVGLSSGMSSVLLQVNVLIALFVGVFYLKEELSKLKRVGATIASLALVMTIIYAQGNITAIGLFLILLSACAWAASSLIVKRSKTKQVFVFNVWGIMFAPIPLIMLAVSLNGVGVISETIQNWHWQSTASVCFQAYPTTLFGYWIWNKLLIKYPFSTVAPSVLLVPVFALISGT